MALSESTNRLYVAAGGNTNLGAPSNNFAGLPEFALSAAILEIDLGAIGDSTYDLPTLNDDSRPGSNDANDPFGGNNGKNQAKLVPGGPVQVYAPGFRNAYDLVLTADGRLYSIDNGGNAGWGGTPKGGGACTNERSEPGITHIDGLHHITGRGYYGGHANPTRGNASNSFNADGVSPVSVSNPIECVHAGTGSNGTLAGFDSSANGLVEYRASNFDGAMQGDLLTVVFKNVVHQLRLDEAGEKVVSNTKLFSSVGGIPLDITAQADWQIFPGTIWVADFQARSIIVFEPGDFDGHLNDVGVTDEEPEACGTVASKDDDQDGFTNGDEIANGTDPCSGADRPLDSDDDRVSDLIDADDDNDGLEDAIDPFALDATNGRGTSIPLDYTWENDSEAPGYLFNLGFSGLMNNGTSDWHDLFDAGNLTTGGAAGVLTIDRVPPTDPYGAKNDQAYGFQFGIDVTEDSEPFVVHTRLVAPLAGASRKPHQSLGLYIGTGDQDNYIKLVANTAGPRGGVEFAAEVQGSFDRVHQGAATVYDSDAVDLLLRVDPSGGTVQAFHRTRDAGVDGEWQAIAAAATLPKAWLDGPTGLAVGLISTSFGAEPFTATWDFIRVGDTAIVDGETTEVGGASSAEDGSPTGAVRQDSDGDGLEDPVDPFPLDAANGRATALPLELDFTGPSGDVDGDALLLGAGFSGLMNDGATDWRSLYDPRSLSIGGVAGVVRIDAVPATDPIRERNDQAYGLQFGIDVTQDTAPFVVQTRVLAPLADATRERYQAVGLFIGTGDQDNYLKLVLNSAGSDGGIEFAAERDGSFERVQQVATRVYGAEWMELSLLVEPKAGRVRAFSRARHDGVDGELVPLGASTQIPAAWLNGQAGLAVGLISTSLGASPFTAIWDFIRIVDAGVVAGIDIGADRPVEGDAMDGDVADAGDGSSVLVIEAESAIRASTAGPHAWQSGSDAGAGGGQTMQALPDNGTLRPSQQFSPALAYRVELPAAGTWHVWVRGRGDTDAGGEGKNDSVHVGLNGRLAGAAAIDRFPAGAWTWSRSTRGGPTARIVAASPGTHELQVWMREDGFEFDRLLLTQDAAFVPQGRGPIADAAANADGAGDAASGSGEPSARAPDEQAQGEKAPHDTAEPTSATPIGAQQGVLRIEAADHHAATAAGTHRWSARADGARVALPNEGELRTGNAGSPRLDYRVAFDRAGTWQVWVHGFGDADASNEGRDDSVHLGLNGALDGASAMDGFPPAWTWSRSRRAGGFATLEVPSPGVHTLNVWMREDGFAFDRLLLIGPGASITGPTEMPDEDESANAPVSGNGDTTTGSPSSASVSANAEWTLRAGAGASRVIARHEGSGVVYQGRLYVMGGRGTRPVSIYDPATNRWRTGANPPIPLNHFQPVLFDRKIWVIGAMTGSYPRETSVAAIYTYDPHEDTWAKAGEVPSSRRRGSMGAAVRGDRIYLLGGNRRGHDGQAVAWFDAFEPRSGAWSVLPDAPAKRDHAPIAIVGDRLVAAGGRRSTQPDVFANTVAGVDVFDFARGSWERTSSIPTPRAGSMVVSVGNEVIVIGGEIAGARTALSTVEAYDVTTRRWRALRSMKTGRHGGAAGLLADGIHAVSGNLTRGGGAETTSHEILPVQR